LRDCDGGVRDKPEARQAGYSGYGRSAPYTVPKPAFHVSIPVAAAVQSPAQNYLTDVFLSVSGRGNESLPERGRW
jgi:hypothetical protein